MKSPLHYRLSEYDCEPTSMLNAISFLFGREDIPPEIMRNIMLYCLDCYGTDGASGKSAVLCVAVVRLNFDGWHYVLLTEIQGDKLRMFYPYYRADPFEHESLHMITDHLAEYNRIVPVRYLEREREEVYSLGPPHTREAVLLFNEHTKFTAEKTVEYMI